MGVGQLWRTPSSSTTALPRAFFVPSYSFTVALIFLHVRVVQFASAHPKPPLLNLPSPLSPWYCFTCRSTLAWWPTLLDFFIGEAHNSRLHLPSPIVVWPPEKCKTFSLADAFVFHLQHHFVQLGSVSGYIEERHIFQASQHTWL